MIGYNKESVIKKIFKICNGAIIKMLITTIAFTLVCIIIKVNDFNYHINNLFMSVCIILSMFFPILSFWNIISTVLESLFHIIVHKRDVNDEIIMILESKFGLYREESFGERLLCRLPFFGPRIAKQKRQELEEVVKTIIGKTFFSILAMIICFIAFSYIIKPTLIKESTGHSTLSLFGEYILQLIRILFRN